MFSVLLIGPRNNIQRLRMTMPEQQLPPKPQHLPIACPRRSFPALSHFCSNMHQQALNLPMMSVSRGVINLECPGHP